MNMKTMKAGQRVFAAAFFAVLCGVWILWLLLGRFTDQENYENRELAEMPKWTAETAEQFPRDFENFFNDRLPFRNQMITLNSGVDYYVFGRSAHYRTTVGKDGWLFYSDSADGNPIACYQGTNLLPEDRRRSCRPSPPTVSASVTCSRSGDVRSRSSSPQTKTGFMPNICRMFTAHRRKHTAHCRL